MRHSDSILAYLILCHHNYFVFGFTSPLSNTFVHNDKNIHGRALFAKGFGSSPGKKEKGYKNKTYGSAAKPSQNVEIIDVEEAMSSFFSSKDEWSTLFRSLISCSKAPARSFLTNGDENEFGLPFSFEDTNTGDAPWKQLDGTPSNQDDLSVVASFLDSMQQSLIEIPVDESTKDDASDLHFIEEGRRMLKISRFHVLTAKGRSRFEQNEELFMTCWSEMAELNRAGMMDTGSLILLPDYDITDLNRFTDMNLQQPLQWMGIGDDFFEVVSLERGSPAIRILHKISGIPKVEGGVERMS